MTKILAIGNSFSSDATTHIWDLAHAVGEPVKVVNLYIGGCPLSVHAYNALGRERDYRMLLNGIDSGFSVSIYEALKSDEWDYVTMQQASRFSHDFTTYQPYLGTLADFVRTYAPKARLAIHQTWAYEQGSDHLAAVGISDHREMFCRLQDAYQKAAQAVGTDIIIPSGDAMQRLLLAGVPSVHRDGTHVSLSFGRYTAAAVWLEVLCGIRAAGNPFTATAEPMTARERSLAQVCAHEAVVAAAQGR